MSEDRHRPSIAELSRIEPGLSKSEVRSDGGLRPSDALRRLPQRYFDSYSTELVSRHLALLCSLSIEEAYALDAVRVNNGETPNVLELTIISIDEPGILSLLTGVLAATGFNIVSGDIYTLEREQVRTVRARNRRASGFRVPTLPHRRIVDRFVGSLRTGSTPESFFAEVTAYLDRVIPLILPGGDRDEARRIVNEAVAERLRQDEASGAVGLYPLEIQFRNESPHATTMTITGEDTPFFLYSLSAALSLQQISIESVSIETHRQVISDTFELLDSGGSPITDAATLDRIRFSVLLTKQFTYFLDQAPDPYAALIRFESMSRDLVRQTEAAGIGSLLSQPLVLRELAQLLGASDFLWEDFIRLQYENIIPMLSRPSELSTDPDELEHSLAELLRPAANTDEKRRALNEFKDREAFLIDLDHILHPDHDFFFLSSRLTRLAEIVVQATLDIAWDSLVPRYGRPRTVAGLEVDWAVLGLGKLGGRALGYASDIELMLVYRDSGTTDGSDPVSNTEFFERLVMEATGTIQSRREGIFQVDLRLRPYGQAGPHAVSLESFVRYYGREGDAHSYEKLALTRLRVVAGNLEFGRRIEELRDDLIYGSDSIDLTELRALRERQFREKTQPGRLNAKFSPGALVDLEYGLQIILVQHGRTNRKLRTPSLHAGLDELGKSGVMQTEETNRLVRAYRFLRNLINGLRMLRGNAQDLFLPDVQSLEFAHLARRAGYTDQDELTAAEQLHVEFEARTAAVRAFLEQHLGRESIPGPWPGNAADLVLASSMPSELTARILNDARLENHDRALKNIAALAGTGPEREVFSELVILVWQALRSNVDPDAALNNWERYASRLTDRSGHFRQLLRQPRMLDLMLQVFATSSFLSNTLIHDPPALVWALDHKIVSHPRSDEEMMADLREAGVEELDVPARRSAIRSRRRRELLRIGTRDICLKAPLSAVTAELSAIARAVLSATLNAIWNELDQPAETRSRFVLLAFGKLGGNELNYSSDIDLLGIYADGSPDERSADARLFGDVLTRLRSDLATHTVEGYAYRVDFRLRPYGSAGPLVQPYSAAVRYYAKKASLWEHQALLKLAPVAGAIELGRQFLDAVRWPATVAHGAQAVRASIRRLRDEAIRAHGEADLKSGTGGIRDVEFLVQGLQMIHAAAHPEVLSPNTLSAISLLREAGVLDGRVATDLADDYLRLRRVEHYLQIYDDRQIHALPSLQSDRDALARRLDGASANGMSLADDLSSRRTRTRAYFDSFLAGEDL